MANWTRREFISRSGAVLTAICDLPLPAGEFIAPIKERKQIALTFDDGPKPAKLPAVLKALWENSAPAAFFFLGVAAAKNPRWVLRAAEAGHEIASHGFGHGRLDRVAVSRGNDYVIENEIRKTENVLRKINPAIKPRFFRPPFWMITESLEKTIAAEGYFVNHLGVVVDPATVFGKPKLINTARPIWQRDVNSLDYEYAEGSGRFNPEAIASVVRRQVKIRERLGVFRHVIAMHELEATTAALAIIVPELRSRGYEFVRLSEFFGFAEKLKAAEKGE